MEYRVIKIFNLLEIHAVKFDNDVVSIDLSSGPDLVGENIEELREELQKFLAALDKPALIYDMYNGMPQELNGN